MDSYIYLKDRAGNNLGTSTNPLVIYATGGATSTTTHNSLLTLQGGDGADEYYHLNASSYASVIAWNVGSGGSGAYAVTSGYATNSGYATAAGSATNASYAVNAAYATISGFATNATFSISSGTATFANVSANATYAASSGTATNASYSSLSAQASALVNGATLSATVIYLDRIGTTTYKTLQDWVNILQSGGRIDGGILTASATAGTLDVSQIDVFIKTATSEIASTKYYTVAATAALALTQNSINYIYVDYNNGVPIIRATTDRTTINYTTQFNLGRAFRELSDEVEVLFSGINLYNRTRRVHERWIDTFGGLSYANGITPTCTGLKPAITGGALYAGSNKITISATDCNAGGTFDYYYTTDGGSTWTTTSTNTLDNLRYNDSATGLATLNNNQYGVHWLYVCPDGDIYVLYGKASYTLSGAQAAQVASPIPNYLSQWAKLCAKIIIAKGITSVQQISVAWTTQFPVQYSANHNDLGGLQGGTTSEYYHIDATSYASVIAWDVGGGGGGAYAAIAGYATIAGTATNATNLNGVAASGYATTGITTRLTEFSTTCAHSTTATTDCALGANFSFDTTVSYGQIARFRLYTDFLAGQQTTAYGTVTAVGGVLEYSTQATYTCTTTNKIQANDYIWIDNECMLVTATTAYSTVATLNITRAQKGTKAAPHDNAAPVFTCNDGVRIEIYPDSNYSSSTRLLKWSGNFTGVWTTNAATGANYSRLNFTTSPALAVGFGLDDLIYITDGASSEYLPVQQVYGDIAGTQYDNSITTTSTTAYAHDNTKVVYRVCELSIPIPYKLVTGTTLYGKMYVDEKITSTVNMTLLTLIDKWGA